MHSLHFSAYSANNNVLLSLHAIIIHNTHHPMAIRQYASMYKFPINCAMQLKFVYLSHKFKHQSTLWHKFVNLLEITLNRTSRRR